MPELTAVFSSPWVPSPIIEACAFRPVPVYDSTDLPKVSSETAFKEGRCPWSHIFAQYAADRDFDAIILTTTCDQMRRSAEAISADTSTPVFVMTVPSTASASALRLYNMEITRLSAFLSRISGTAATSTTLCEAIKRSRPPTSLRRDGNIPICLLGSHLPIPFDDLDAIIGRTGGYIAVNGLETADRCTPDLSKFRAGGGPDEIIAYIADAYFNSIRDVFRRPNSDFYRWIALQIKKEMPKGILLVRNSWCDQWAIEAIRLRNWSKLPTLELEFTSNAISMSAISRTEAFMETCMS